MVDGIDRAIHLFIGKGCGVVCFSELRFADLGKFHIAAPPMVFHLFYIVFDIPVDKTLNLLFCGIHPKLHPGLLADINPSKDKGAFFFVGGRLPVIRIGEGDVVFWYGIFCPDNDVGIEHKQEGHEDEDG